MKKRFWTVMAAAGILACFTMAVTAGADQLEDIVNEGKIKVGVEGTYPPFTYHDESGELVGFDVEVAKALAQKLGVEASFTESDWDSLLAAIDSRRLDTVINDVSVTEERKKKYDFSDPYFFIARQMVCSSDNDTIHSMEDLNGKKIATNMTNSYAQQLEDLGATIVPISTSDEAATLVLSGRADVCMFNTVILADYLKQHPDAALKVAFVVPEKDEEIAIPLRKGEEPLLEAVNKALNELREDGTLRELSEKYFDGDYTTPSSEEETAQTEE